MPQKSPLRDRVAAKILDMMFTGRPAAMRHSRTPVKFAERPTTLGQLVGLLSSESGEARGLSIPGELSVIKEFSAAGPQDLDETIRHEEVHNLLRGSGLAPDAEDPLAEFIATGGSSVSKNPVHAALMMDLISNLGMSNTAQPKNLMQMFNLFKSARRKR